MGGPWAARFIVALHACILSGGSIASAEGSDSKDEAPATEAKPGEADDPETLIAQGVEFRKRREDRAALTAFERAWKLGGAPRALAQLALAEQALGLWREAFEHLELALNRIDDDWIASHHTTLELALGEIASRLGTVEISCDVDGAEVKVDGRSVGRTPLQHPLRLVAGQSIVQVVADGYFETARPVQVDAGNISRVSLSLTPIAVPAFTATAPVSVAPSPPPLEVSQQRDTLAPKAALTPLSEPAESGPSTRDVLAYTSLGLAGLGATVGVAGYAIRETNISSYNDDARCDQQQGPRRSVECKGEYAAWQNGELMAIVGSSAAGVFGLTALYLWWSRPDAGAANQLSCAVTGPGISCGSAF